MSVSKQPHERDGLLYYRASIIAEHISGGRWEFPEQPSRCLGELFDSYEQLMADHILMGGGSAPSSLAGTSGSSAAYMDICIVHLGVKL